MTEKLAVVRRRLRFRSWHRGTREMDFLLGRFADAVLDRYEVTSLDRYAHFLEESDPDIYDWFQGRAVPENEGHRMILKDLMGFHRSAGAKPR